MVLCAIIFIDKTNNPYLNYPNIYIQLNPKANRLGWLKKILQSISSSLWDTAARKRIKEVKKRGMGLAFAK